MISIRRLPTRDLRENLTSIRKKLWLIRVFSQKYVLLWVNKGYSKIYEKYLTASGIANKVGLCAPRHLIRIPSLRTSILTWEGENVAEDFQNLGSKEEKKVIFKILDWLKKFNSFNNSVKNEDLEFRYIKLLLKKYKELNLNKNLIFKIKELTNKINKGKKVISGPGIEDSALSNFTYLNGNVCLVDLDNFSDSVNFCYELGFLMADLEINHHFSSEETSRLQRRYIKLRELEEDFSANIFSFGKISRYGIAALNLSRNTNHFYSTTLEKIAKKITEELDSRIY